MSAAATLHDLSGDDLDALGSCMAAAFDPRFGEAWSTAQCIGILSMPGYRLRVARAAPAGALVGFAACRVVAGESELLLLAVDPEEQGRGIGRLLLDDWIALALGDGASKLFLEVRADNPARRIYQTAGFAVVGRRPDYYRGADGILRDAITMARSY